MQVSEVPAVRVSRQICAARGAKPGNVGRREQKIILGYLNADFGIMAEKLRALVQVGGSNELLAICHTARLDQVRIVLPENWTGGLDGESEETIIPSGAIDETTT
jgi:hypothetical protein